jgi:hypothetical protein
MSNVAESSIPAGGARRRRRGAWIAAAVAIVVIGVGGAALALRPSGPQPLPPDGLFLAGTGADGQFADEHHGYVMLGRCPTDNCETWVGATDDGGRSWRVAMVPGLTFAKPTTERPASGPRGRLIVLDATRVVIDGYHDTPGFDSPDHHRWHTADGGRTWSSVAVTPIATVEEIPEHSLATVDYDDSHWAERGLIPGDFMVRIIRADGSSAVLATPPQLPRLTQYGDVTAGPDGYWLKGATDEGPVIAHTRDHGRSWTQLPMPDAVPVRGHGYDIYPADLATIYLVDHGAFLAWRSTDGGAHWEQLKVPFDSGGMDFGLEGHALPDGRLVVIKPVINGQDVRAEYLAITATGTTFEPVDPATLQAQLRNGVPQFGLQPGATDRAHAAVGVVTKDGWIALPFPCSLDSCR